MLHFLDPHKRPRSRARRIGVSVRVMLAGAGVLMFASQAQADTQIYGILDTTIRYSTNTNANKDSKFELGEGPITGSRIGFKGTEDLGGQMKAFFLMEGGIDLSTGQSLQSSTSTGYGQQTTNGAGRLFGRQIYVGLDSSAGTVSFGRQYGVAYQAMGISQIFGNPNQDTVLIVANYTGSRLDNMVKYEKRLGDFKVSADYVFGEVVGNMRANSGKAVAVGYGVNGLDLTASYQKLSDGTGSDARNTYGLAAGYKFGNYQATFGYLNNRYDVSKTKNDVIIAGLGYRPASNWSFGIGAFTDEQKDVTGRRNTVYAIADYSFSKKTDIYFEVDDNKITGGYKLITSQGATGNKLGMSLGLRTYF